jgi:predicted DNA-binding transcriptional regulator AlpA
MATVLSDYLNRAQLAAELGICMRTLIRWEAQGDAPPITKLGRRPYFRRAAVDQWLASRERVAA